jgi:hypothetical protein
MSNECCESLCGASSFVCGSQSALSSLVAHMPLRSIIASSAGSIITTLTLNPINVMKVYFQSTHQADRSLSLGKGVQLLFRRNGLKAFWAGTSTGLIMSVPNTVSYMASYEAIKESLYKRASSKQQELFYTGTLII